LPLLFSGEEVALADPGLAELLGPSAPAAALANAGVDCELDILAGSDQP
jgi:hypothetical protein